MNPPTPLSSPGNTRARRAVRQLDFVRRAVAGSPRERHELQARARGRLDAARWRLWNRRRKQPALLVGMIEHMGDIIACEPVARHLRREHPEAVLAWAVRPAFRGLVEHHPDIDAVVPASCLTHWMMLRDHAGFDRVFDLHVHGRSCDDCIVKLDNARHTRQIDATNYYAHGPLLHCACALAGLPRLDDTPRMIVPSEAIHRVSALRLPTDFGVVHARSSQPRRDWDEAKWRPLVRRLRDEAGLPVVEVGLDPVLRDTGDCRSLCGQLSILETAEVIRRASLFIGVDSGPAHMANALGTPGVVLLGRYEAFDRYMPYTGRFAEGRHARVIQWPEPANEIPVEHVFEAATSLVPAKELAV